MHSLDGKKIVVASHNEGKLREFADLMGPFGFEAKSAKDYGLPEPDETGTTFEENAYIKALAAAKATGLPALSDDSGLCVDALVGRADIVIKSLTENFVAIRGISGASIMGDGAVCLMLDSTALVELACERAVSVGTRK